MSIQNLYVYHTCLLSIYCVPNIHNTKMISWETSICGMNKGWKYKYIYIEIINLHCMPHFPGIILGTFARQTLTLSPKTRSRHRHLSNIVLSTQTRITFAADTLWNTEHTALMDLITPLYLCAQPIPLWEHRLYEVLARKRTIKFLVHNSLTKLI